MTTKMYRPRLTLEAKERFYNRIDLGYVKNLPDTSLYTYLEMFDSSATKPLDPYYDRRYGIDMSKNVYGRYEQRTEVDDELLEKYIYRVLLSSAMSDENGDTVNENEQMEGRAKQSDNSDRVSDKGRKKKKKGRLYLGKREEEEEEEEKNKDFPNGTKFYLDQDREPMICVPATQFRKFVRSEVDSRAREIHEFYEEQWREVMTERLHSFRELISCQEFLRQLRRELSEAEKELSEYKGYCTMLSKQVGTYKEAKKRRRHAKKARKNEQTNNGSGDHDEEVRDINDNNASRGTGTEDGLTDHDAKETEKEQTIE
ncbi:hypothetical protein CHS0354_031289 [Potamilus streckersoni]|uniref:Uncharacterized protein n=1 Tax=Potamilus streckersoni TaxID=2493646 RepID=A0AAE0TCG1_9BIVA|nr:hypothetical protein CHS0354_031289 [Potamilus streckersoni]